MTGVVSAVKQCVPEQCQTSRCKAIGCAVSVGDASTSRVIIDLDCEALDMRDKTRCDYVVIVEQDDDAWVAPIELKSGLFSGDDVARQLQGGANFAASLPAKAAKHFVPILAHGRGIHKVQLLSLRKQRIAYRGRRHQIVAIRCGQSIADAL